MIARIRLHLSTADGATGCALVLVCGLLLGYFVDRTFVNRLPTKYPIDFGGAAWIRNPADGSAGYFRKNLYIAGPIEQAWLAIGATGSYQLYVNNLLIDNQSLPAARPSGLYDLTGILNRGKNTVALYVSPDWWTGSKEILVRGAYRIPGGDAIEFRSDRSWKTGSVGDSVAGSVLWSATQYDDSGWQDAKVGKSAENISAVEPLGFDPRLFQDEPVGKWVGGPTDQGATLTFSYPIEVRGSADAAWLQVAANGSYDVVIDGRPAVLNSSINQAALFGPSAPVPLGGGGVLAFSQTSKTIGPESGLPGTASLWSLSMRQNPRLPGPQYRMMVPSVKTDVGGWIGLTSAIPYAPAVPESGAVLPDRGVPRLQRTSPSHFALTGIKPQTRQLIWKPSPPRNRGPNLRLQVLQTPVNSTVSALSPPSLQEISADPVPPAPQAVPMTSTPGQIPSAALAMTGYDIRDFLRAGTNRLEIQVRSPIRSPVLLVNGFIERHDGSLQHFGTDEGWHISANGARRLRLHPATVLGGYSDGPWGPPIRVAAYPGSLPKDDVTTALAGFLTISAVAVLALLLWLISAEFWSRFGKGAGDLWNDQAVFNSIMTLGLLVMLLLSFDIRCAYDWCFQKSIVGAVVIIYLVGNLALLPLARKRPPVADAPEAGAMRAAAASGIGWQPLLLLIIVIGGFLIRASGLRTDPLGHDEVSMMILSRGILKAGFPYHVAGSFTRLMSTYELVPYPMALFSAVLGPSVVAYRLPALLFGTAMIGLVGFVGKRMFDWRVGLVAALIWALLPIPINWSHDGFYPSQESFFALATVWCFYEAIRGSSINSRYLVFATAGFLLSYFSWEASGFLLPTLAVALVAMKWPDHGWVRNSTLWKCLGISAIVVIVQLCYRQLTLTPNYLGVIRDLSELSSPSLVAIDRLTFDPFYYIYNLFLAENHVVLTLLATAGFFFFRRRQPILYLAICLITLYIAYTGFLDHYAPRYCFNWLPLLVLAGVGSLFCLLDRIAAIPVCFPIRTLRVAALCGAALIMVLSSNQFVLKLFRMAPDPADPVWFDRVGVPFKADYGDCDKFVANHMHEGDVVVTRAPHVFLFYTGRMADYSINPLMVFRMYYDGGLNPPGYADKWIGIPVIRNLDELKNVRDRARRVWVITDTPYPYTSEVIGYLRIKGRLVYESIRQQVIVLDGVSAFPVTRTAAATPDGS